MSEVVATWIVDHWQLLAIVAGVGLFKLFVDWLAGDEFKPKE